MLGTGTLGSGALPPCLDNPCRDGVEPQVAGAVPLCSPNPAHGIRIRRRQQVSPNDPAKIVGNHIVESHTFSLGGLMLLNPIDELNQCDGLNFKPGFFLDLANHSIGKRFPQFQDAARQGPLPLRRLMASLDEQNPILMHNHRRDADNRRLRKFSLQHCDHLSLSSIEPI